MWRKQYRAIDQCPYCVVKRHRQLVPNVKSNFRLQKVVHPMGDWWRKSLTPDLRSSSDVAADDADVVAVDDFENFADVGEVAEGVVAVGAMTAAAEAQVGAEVVAKIHFPCTWSRMNDCCQN
jgi:hypothetical protein